MDMKQIRELVRLMGDNDLAEIDIATGEDKIRIRKNVPERAMTTVPAAAPVVVPAALPAAPVAAPAAPPAAPAEALLDVKSPMVGTFYSAPSPDADPYVAVGAALGAETVVCIIEAMKVMNEIKAECAGQVVEVCVKNAQPVEYGQVLFRVRPA